MTFSNMAYGEGTFVRCDVCRDPEALQTPRPNSELILTPTPADAGLLVGPELAAARAEDHGFVRVGRRLLCRGCAVAATLPPDAPEELVALNERGRVWMMRPHA